MSNGTYKKCTSGSFHCTKESWPFSYWWTLVWPPLWTPESYLEPMQTKTAKMTFERRSTEMWKSMGSRYAWNGASPANSTGRPDAPIVQSVTTVLRSLTTTVRGSTIASVAETIATFSCFSSRCQSTWPPYLFYASFMCFTTEIIWRSPPYWFPSLSWASYPYSLSLFSDWLVFISSWSAGAERQMNKLLENSGAVTTHFPKTAVTIVAIPSVDLNIPGILIDKVNKIVFKIALLLQLETPGQIHRQEAPKVHHPSQTVRTSRRPLGGHWTSSIRSGSDL